MTSGKITTNISGGSVNIGNISQGDHNRNIAGAQSTAADSAFCAFFRDLEQLSAAAQHTDAEIAALRAEIADLQLSLRAGAPSRASLVDKARRLYEKYGWAAGALKSLLTLVIPGVTL
jgi:hypothetical protein